MKYRPICGFVPDIAATLSFAYNVRNPLYVDVFPGFESLVLLSATGFGYYLLSWLGLGMIVNFSGEGDAGTATPVAGVLVYLRWRGVSIHPSRRVFFRTNFTV